LRVDVRLGIGTTASAANVRCGASVCDVKAKRTDGALEVLVWARIGPPVWVTLAAALAAPPAAAEIDGQSLQPHVTPEQDGVRASLSFQAGTETEVHLLL
jgi:hypothetical protein